jgi:plasmid stabilization system protein ParE
VTVTYAEGVFEELVEISFYLSSIDEVLAQRFLDSCDETFRSLAKNKYLGVERNFGNPKLFGVRMWHVKAFERYLIFYVPTEIGVKILYVLHSSTDYDSIIKGSG